MNYFQLVANFHETWQLGQQVLLGEMDIFPTRNGPLICQIPV